MSYGHRGLWMQQILQRHDYRDHLLRKELRRRLNRREVLRYPLRSSHETTPGTHIPLNPSTSSHRICNLQPPTNQPSYAAAKRRHPSTSHALSTTKQTLDTTLDMTPGAKRGKTLGRTQARATPARVTQAGATPTRATPARATQEIAEACQRRIWGLWLHMVENTSFRLWGWIGRSSSWGGVSDWSGRIIQLGFYESCSARIPDFCLLHLATPSCI